jgi:hypothetical protein
VGFEILLEGYGLCFVAEGSGNFDFPRSECLPALQGAYIREN